MKPTRSKIVTIFICITVLLGFLPSAYAGYPQTIATSYPYINLPRPSDDQKWAEAFSHWDKREDTRELFAAVDMFESLVKDYPGRLEPQLWLARSLYSAAVREPKNLIGYLERGVVAADKVLSAEPDNIFARFWRYNMVVFTKGYTETEYVEIMEFFAQFRNLHILPVPDDDALWDEAMKLWNQRLSAGDMQKILTMIQSGKDVTSEDIKSFYQKANDAIKIFEKLDKKYPNRIEPKLWLAFCNDWIYSFSFGIKYDVKYTEIALHWADKALEQEPLNPAANFLYGLCLTDHSTNKSFFALVRNVRKIARCLKRSAEEDPFFYYSGHSWLANAGLGSVGKIVVKILKIMGYPIALFEDLGDFVVNAEPNFFKNRYYLAQMLKAIGKEDEAKKEFEIIVNSDPTILKNWEIDNRIFQYKAMKILKEEFKQEK